MYFILLRVTEFIITFQSSYIYIYIYIYTVYIDIILYYEDPSILRRDKAAIELLAIKLY